MVVINPVALLSYFGLSILTQILLRKLQTSQATELITAVKSFIEQTLGKPRCKVWQLAMYSLWRNDSLKSSIFSCLIVYFTASYEIKFYKTFSLWIQCFWRERSICILLGYLWHRQLMSASCLWL